MKRICAVDICADSVVDDKSKCWFKYDNMKNIFNTKIKTNIYLYKSIKSLSNNSNIIINGI